MKVRFCRSAAVFTVLLAFLSNGCSMSASGSSVPLNQDSSITFTLTPSSVPYICDGPSCYSPLQIATLFDSEKLADINIVDIDGNVTGLLTTANDKGLDGDATAGDGIYTVTHVFHETQDGMIRVLGEMADTNVEIVAGTLPSQSDLETAGAAVYSSNCTSCHRSDGMGLGQFPALSGSPITTGYPISDNISIVMNGAPGGSAMSAYDGTLTDDELAAVITYIRNDFGNATGDVIYASDIRAFRNAQGF